MKIRNRILLDPAPILGGGGAPPAEFGWPAALPPDVAPTIASKGWKTPYDAVKSYGELEKLVGTARLPEPQKNWGKAEWDGFYNKIGRPEKPDGYKVPEKIGEVAVDKEKYAKAISVFHEAGLRQDQVDKIMGYYGGVIQESETSSKQQKESARAESLNKLRSKFGDKFEPNVELARAVIMKHAPEGFLSFLDESGLGDHPHMVEFAHKIGTLMSDDVLRDTTPGGGGFVTNATQASLEIDRLSADPEFQKILGSRSHPGHQGALEKWSNLFKTAHPGKQT